MNKIILVTGSREFTNKEMLEGRLRDAIGNETDYQVVVGDARGADQLTRAFIPKTHRKVFRADWTQHAKGAGHARNQTMVDYVMTQDAANVVCLAFFVRDQENRGTWNCVMRANKAGIHVRHYWQEPVVLSAPVRQVKGI